MAKENKFPSEIIDLPSGGKVYPPDSQLASGKLEDKYMTAKEEDIHKTIEAKRVKVLKSNFLNKYIYSAIIFLILMGRAVYFMDHWKSHSKNNFATYSFIFHAVSYYEHVHAFQNIKWTHEDEKVFKHLGISVHPPQIQHTTPLKKPLNLILVYLESFQSNFTEIGQSEYPELTPYLDQFIQTYTFVENYYKR